MATTYFRHATNTEVARIWKGTITTTTDTHTYIVTITDDNGDTAAITYTVVNPPDTTVTLVGDGFVAAWNASLNPLISKFTASNSSGQITLTADSAGRPYSIAASGTGTWSGDANTTNSVDNGDYGQASNWSLDATPTTNDDVIIGKGTTEIDHGLNASSAAIDEFTVEPGFSGKIGRIEDGKPHYLRIDPNSLYYYGRSSRAYFDVGSANIDLLFNGSGSQETTGIPAVVFKGSNIDVATILSGNVGCATFDADTATVATIYVGANTSTAPTVTIGAGVTLTTLDAIAGTIYLDCAATTATIGTAATGYTEGTGAITTLNVYGTAYPNSAGTITNLHVYGVCDLTKDKTPRTVTNCTTYPGSTLIRGSHITFTNNVVHSGVGTHTVIVKG